jgi:hypothetical protein
MYIIAILIGILGAYTFAVIDSNVLKVRFIYKHEKPKRVIIRGLWFVLSYSYFILTKPISITACLLAISITTFALFFDGFLNKRLNLPWLYRGTESVFDELSQGQQFFQQSIYISILIIFSIIYFVC